MLRSGATTSRPCGRGWAGTISTVREAATLFTDVEIDSVPVYYELTADRLNGLLRTTSLYARLDPDQQVRLEHENRLVAERAGGVVRSSELAVLVTARMR